MDINTRAEILIQAMPYIQKNYGKTIVVKYGGNAMQSEELKQAVMDDIVLMQLVGINVVLVHGGGPEINEMLVKTGKKSKFVDGLRVTDKETIDIVQQVLAGRVNKSLVQHLTQSGGRAIGLCGLDGKMLMAKKLESENDLGYVGQIESVNPLIIMDSLKNGYIPVISTIAGGKNGEVYNINADLAASRIAAKLSAKKLILMTDVRGLLRNVKDESTLVSTVNVSDVPSLKKDGIIKGGMIPKIDCCVEAVRSGVGRAHILDGRIKHSILLELFSDEGIGTMLY
ncbi:MAG: acetylglutamate kinase [Ruminococcus sp.]|nr:acetylglutamate kinase [Ruminococcus sp.]